MAYRMQDTAPMTKKGGRGRRGKQEVVEITPVILVEIRDMHRDLSERMDRLEQRVDAFRQETHERLCAVEAALFRNQ